MRLIDADNLITDMSEKYVCLIVKKNYDEFRRGFSFAMDFVRKAQTVERSEEKKAPVFKEGTSLVHMDYTDGHSDWKERKWAEWVCPICGWFVGEQYIPRRHNQQKSNFCSRCGQEIDWKAVEATDETNN